MRYSRSNPSPMYGMLLSMYKAMHTDGLSDHDVFGNRHDRAANDVFPGDQLPAYAEQIKKLIDKHKATSILDYGAGKGQQYETMKIQIAGSGQTYQSVKEYWGIDTIECFDPGVASSKSLQQSKVSGIISTDVLEHCYIDDIPWIVEEMFELAEKFVFVNIACYPALTILPNGENAHITVRSFDWWGGLFESIAARHDEVDYRACCACPDLTGKLHTLIFEKRHNL